MSEDSDLGVESLFRELDRRAQVEIFTQSNPLVIIEQETFQRFWRQTTQP